MGDSRFNETVHNQPRTPGGFRTNRGYNQLARASLCWSFQGKKSGSMAIAPLGMKIDLPTDDSAGVQKRVPRVRLIP